jgi:DNA-directed RNA polymerase subunit M/transcription elongation factor TFIIS
MNSTRTHILSEIKRKLTEKKAENVEKSIYNYTIQYAGNHNLEKSWENKIFTHVYKLKACNILNTLTESMIENIETKKISAKNIAFEKETAEDTVDESEVTDGIFQCRKCGSKKTTYYSLQTRSADEPMTNFITCVHCKHRWKM